MAMKTYIQASLFFFISMYSFASGQERSKSPVVFYQIESIGDNDVKRVADDVTRILEELLPNSCKQFEFKALKDFPFVKSLIDSWLKIQNSSKNTATRESRDNNSPIDKAILGDITLHRSGYYIIQLKIVSIPEMSIESVGSIEPKINETVDYKDLKEKVVPILIDKICRDSPAPKLRLEFAPTLPQLTIKVDGEIVSNNHPSLQNWEYQPNAEKFMLDISYKDGSNREFTFTQTIPHLTEDTKLIINKDKFTAVPGDIAGVNVGLPPPPQKTWWKNPKSKMFWTVWGGTAVAATGVAIAIIVRQDDLPGPPDYLTGKRP